MRKVLDAVDVQGSRDMSGFEFEVTAADATSVGRLTTTADGHTPSIEAIAGTYTIRETARPPWARVLGDPGPMTFVFEPADAGDVRELAYVNTVADASIATAARDGADGDQVIDVERGAARIIDTVAYTSLVPGTAYVVTGELMVRATGAIADASDPAMGASSVALPELMATGVTGSTSFVPMAPDGRVDVEFTIPADSPLRGHTVVVFQRLEVASSGRVVARHADPDATDQTIRIAATSPPSTTSTTSTTTTLAPTAASASTTSTTAASTTVAVEPLPPTTAQPSRGASTTTAPPTSSTQLPRTGTDGTRSATLTAVGLVLLGLAALFASRRPASQPR